MWQQGRVLAERLSLNLLSGPRRETDETGRDSVTSSRTAMKGRKRRSSVSLHSFTGVEGSSTMLACTSTDRLFPRRLYNNIIAPSLLSANSNYYLFKQGIKPAWEDDANEKGGKWSVQLPRGKYTDAIDNMWLYTVRPLSSLFPPFPLRN